MALYFIVAITEITLRFLLRDHNLQQVLQKNKLSCSMLHPSIKYILNTFAVKISWSISEALEKISYLRERSAWHIVKNESIKMPICRDK